MTHHSAIIIGATGLIGSNLLKLLLDAPNYDMVYSVSRQHIALAHPKLKQILLDNFDHLEEAICTLPLVSADAYCTLGTTIKVAKTKQRFKEIDFGYALSFANAVFKAGANHFLLVSAAGANPQSLIFYNQVKGQLEQALRQIGFAQLSLFRPSLLLGRKNHHRLLEGVSAKFFESIYPLLPNAFALKPVYAAQVAQSMLLASQRVDLITKVYSNKMILQQTLA